MVKCFPAEALGGLPYIKALSGPYSSVKFMPTGGVGPGNIVSYLNFKKVLACGGSWMVDAAKIAAGDYAGITRMCRQAVDTVLGLRFSHVGLNSAGAADAARTAALLSPLLGAPAAETGTVLWLGDGVEILKKQGRGNRGHLSVGCNSLDRAVFQLRRRGLAFDEASAGTDSTGHRYIFLKDEIAGFAVHLSER